MRAPSLRILSALFVLLCATACAPRQSVPDEPVAHMTRTVENMHRAQEYLPKQTFYLPTIVLDAGHGGKDEGTVSDSNKYQEKQLTLQTVKLVRHYLQKLGYKVILTRSKDLFLPLEKRASIANQAKGDIFVSMHYNSAKNREASGIEVFYYESKATPKRTRESKQLAEEVLNQLLEATGARSRGVKHSNFAVIRLTDMAAILVEGGFLTNSEERQKIKNPQYLHSLAWGVAKGIDRFLKVQGKV